MQTEIIISPIQAVTEVSSLMNQVAQIEPDGARSVTRLARSYTFFAITARRREGHSVADQATYSPDAESSTAYATKQAYVLTEHLNTMIKKEGTDLSENATVIARQLSFTMREKLETLTRRIQSIDI